MSTPTTDRPGPTTTTDHLSRAELTRLRRSLSQLRVELDAQMRSASATLQELREGFSLTDPDIQAPLMTALHTLDAAERSSIDVADALQRLQSGTYGVCGRCQSPVPVERLELRPAGRYCVACSR